MLEKLCRLCGTKHDNMMNIFDEFNQVQKIQFKIHKVLQIKIDEEDTLPTKICKGCIRRLENAFHFINYCYETQIHLKKIHDTLLMKQDEQTLNCGTPDAESKNNTSIDSSDTCNFFELNENEAENVKNNKFNVKLEKYSENNIQKFATVEEKYKENSINNDARLYISNVKNTEDTENGSETFIRISNKRKRIVQNFKFCINDITQKTIINNHNFVEITEVKNEINIPSVPDIENRDNNTCDSDDYNELCSDYIKDSNCVPSKQEKKSANKRKRLTKLQLETSNSTADIKLSKKSELSVTINSDENKNLKESDNGVQMHKELKDKKRLTCDTCKMTFTQELTYEEHLNVHTGNRPFSCKICEASFRKRQELNQHLRTVHSEKHFKCSLCEHIAKHKGKLTEHMKSVHEKPFACDLCNYRTGEKGKITQHIANKHTGDLSYVCEICGNGFKTKNSLQTHRQNIHFPEPKVCQTCGTICPSLSRYSAHIFRCGKEKKRYPCEKCGQTYVNKEILKDHMNKHLNIRPYKCDICGKEFFQRNRLDTHKYVHRGPVYRCEVCNQSFNRKDNMKNHMRKHFYKSMRYDNMIVTAV